jgi:phenylpropionate dioxygenase-like ring-hydroxylating dioxygenase large terminal subunit
MLSIADNEYITRVGKGTPMGDYLRRYWHPFMESSQLPDPDGNVIEVTLLGEELIAFRDTSGRVGLLGHYCPHRSAPLYYGRNEEDGLRCIYHGWKFDVSGRCVDMPSEPAASNFKEKVRARGYPVEERGGVLWAYLGPPSLTPDLPDLEWTMLLESRRMMAHFALNCNWVQTLEGDVDSSHVGFLHQTALRSSVGADTNYVEFDKAPHWTIEQTDYGMALAARRETLEGAKYYWRINQWFLPYYTLVASDVARTKIHSHIWVPIDDLHTTVWCVEWTTEPRDLTASERWSMTEGPFAHIPTLDVETHTLRANASNHYLQDRRAQKAFSFSGINGTREQDAAVVEGMGALVDRTIEHLGTSDTAIITLRRRLIQDARALEDGIEPHVATDGTSYRRRSWSAVLDKKIPYPESPEMREMAAIKL